MDSQKENQQKNKPFQGVHGDHDTTFSILIIGTEAALFLPLSSVRKRIASYGQFLSSLNIIVFAKKANLFTNQKIAHNVWVYPTQSRGKFWYIKDTILIGKKINRPDLVTAQDPFESGLAAWRVARWHRAKLELQIHTDPFTRFFIFESFLNLVRFGIMLFLLPRADHIRVMSERIAQKIIARGVPKENISVLPIFVPSPQEMTGDTAIPSLPSFSHTTLLVSRLSKEKNIPLALHSFQKSLEGNKTAGLVIVGDGPERKLLEKLVQRLGLLKNVVFVGWQENPFPFYKKSQLYLMTSHYEGFGRTLIEAAYCGLPILSTPVGIAKEVGAMVVEPKEFSLVLSSIISGKEKINPSHLPTNWYSFEEEYLERLQKSWEDCF